MNRFKKSQRSGRVLNALVYLLLMVIVIRGGWHFAGQPAPQHVWKYVSGQIGLGEFQTGKTYTEWMRDRKPGPFDEALWRDDPSYNPAPLEIPVTTPKIRQVQTSPFFSK